MRRNGMVKWVGIVLLAVAYFGVCGVCEGADPNSGFTAWALLGANPEVGRVQELRVGYDFASAGALSGIEPALAVRHLDGPDPAVQEWSGRAYLIAHALDARMVMQLLGAGFTLPNGNLYGGIFGEYSYDREQEWSGGYIVGGMVEWPGKWQSVIEYETNVWNNDRDSFAVVLGLRRKF